MEPQADACEFLLAWRQTIGGKYSKGGEACQITPFGVEPELWYTCTGIRNKAWGRKMFIRIGAGECAIIALLLLVVIGSVVISIRLRR
jgi:hypothetical protein